MSEKQGLKKDTRMLKNESGRSMVEMLGVLVIIGILSLSGITWYRYLVNKRMANDIVNEVKQRALLISVQRMATDRDELNESEFLPTIQGVFPTTQELHPHASGFFVVNVDQIPQDVCSHILKLEWELPVKIYWNLVQDTDSYPHPQCPEGNALLSFVFDDELRGRSIPFNPGKRGCVSDEDCPVENCEICVYQQCERMCMGNEVCSSGSCDCPLNHFIDEETKECRPCPENMTTTTPNATICECVEPNVLDLNTGACVCPDGFYINNGVCTPCPEDTLGSVGPDATACLCNEANGFFWNGTECEHCIQGKTAQDVSRNPNLLKKCSEVKCDKGYFHSYKECVPDGVSKFETGDGSCRRIEADEDGNTSLSDEELLKRYKALSTRFSPENWDEESVLKAVYFAGDPQTVTAADIRKKLKELLNGYVISRPSNSSFCWVNALSWCEAQGYQTPTSADIGGVIQTIENVNMRAAILMLTNDATSTGELRCTWLNGYRGTGQSFGCWYAPFYQASYNQGAGWSNQIGAVCKK